MSATVFCPTCHQSIAIERAGVRLSPLKAAIYDAIRAAGDMGISTDGLIMLVRDRCDHHITSNNTIKAHIHQLREYLVDSGQTIVCDRGRPALWRIECRREVAA